MKLIFIWGPAASGKLTVARELAKLTGLPVFHNHLVVDALLEKLSFGDPEFVRLREAMWMAAFETAARTGSSLIFTFAPEPTVVDGFAQRAIELVEGEGGKVRFARLTVSIGEQERRLMLETRKEFRKLTSLDVLRALRDDFSSSEAKMPEPDLILDTETVSPQQAARRIQAAFGLTALSAAT